MSYAHHLAPSLAPIQVEASIKRDCLEARCLSRKYKNSGNPSEGPMQQVARGATHRQGIPTLLPSTSVKMIKTRAVTMTSSQAKRASGCCQMVVISRMGEIPWCVIHSPNAAKGKSAPAKQARR